MSSLSAAAVVDGLSSASVAPVEAPVVSEEDELRRQLRLEMQSLNRREPLDPTYKKLVLSRDLTNVIPTLSKDKFYKRIGSRLREKVERYMLETRGKDPFDRISQRQPMDEDAMRSAFTLREAKDHEQIPLLEATLAAQSMHPERKRHLDGIALALQTTRSEKKLRSSSPKNAAQQTEDARRRAEIEAQREQARQWEETRKKLEEKERRRREEESYMAMRRKADSPQQALHKIIEPVFKKLWDMEFPALNKTNPFRIVIDRENCASIGAPDYFSVITIPMNLTYIKRKIDTEQYTTLQQFFVSMTYIFCRTEGYEMYVPHFFCCLFFYRAMWISCWPTPSNTTRILEIHIDMRPKK